MSEMHKRLLTPVEASELLSIGKTKVYELMASGELGSVVIGNRRYVPLLQLDDYVASLIAEQEGSAA